MTWPRVLLPLALVASLGCPAVPGTRPAGSSSFTLSGPKEPLTVLHGKTVPAPVTVQWKGSPANLTEWNAWVEPRDQGVKARITAQGDAVKGDGARVDIEAGELAMPGDYKVTVTAKARGETAHTEIAVVVPRKD